MARAGGGTVDAAVTVFQSKFDGGADGNAVTAFVVSCLSTSLAVLEVNSPQVHGADWAPIQPGGELIVMDRKKSGGNVQSLQVRSGAPGTNATYNFAVMAK